MTDADVPLTSDFFKLMIRRFVFAFLLSVGLTACDSGEPNKLTPMSFEGPESEAVVRYMVAHLPSLEPEVPKLYCVVSGPRLTPTTMAFAAKFSDLKLTFIDGRTLKVREGDKVVVDPTMELSPITLQIRDLTKAGENWDVVAGWAYKKTWERHRYKLTPKGSSWEVHDAGRTEGNYVPEVH